MKEGITEKDRIEIIRSKTYNNKKFVNININKKNEVNATISIKGDDDAITDFVEISNSSITTKDFLDALQKKYRSKKLSIEDAEKAVNLIDIKNDKDYLKINNLKLIQLSTQDNKLVVSETNTIDDALEKLYPKGSEDIFFISNGELLTDKKIPVSKCSKNIQILNIKEKKITLKFLPEDLQIDPILIDKDNIKIMKSLECLKKEIISIAKINRDIKFTINEDEGIKITDKMLETNKITITLNVTFKPANFKFKTADGHKKNISFTNETIRYLEKKYDCDKIQLFDDGQALEDDTKFINLTPSKTYKISLFDKFFLSQPKFEKLDDSKGEKYIISEKETTEVYLKRFETYRQYVDDKFKDIPFLIFKGTKNITDQQVDKRIKTSKDEPLILKINYEFRIKEGIKPLRTTFYTLDKYDTNIIKFIADKIFLSSTNRVEAILNKNNETKKKIKDNDKFSSLNYKKGYAIEATLLPPNLKFKIDQTYLNNIQINDENLPESFEKSFPPETTVKEAKKIIRNDLKIANNILFETKVRKLEDNDLMFEIPESSFITIQLIIPTYTFNFKGSDKVINLKTNLTFSTALKELKDKKIIKLQSNYHDIEFYIKKEGKEIVLDKNSKIVDIYEKGTIFCRELDPSYCFIYEKKKSEIRIPDNTNFKEIRNYVKERFEQLKDIQSSRIKFFNGDKQYKNKDIINKKCSENRKINIKLLSPKYNFEFDGEKIPLRLEEECTVRQAIEIVKDEIEADTFDIKLKQDSDELKDDQVLFDQNLYDKTLIVEKIPLMFHFRLNDSEEITSLRFYLDDSGDSAKTSFKDIYDKKCIRLHEDLINFDLLDHKPTKDVKIPPIERFVITNEKNEQQKYENKFLSIINNNKEKIIGIKLLPPEFIFKMRNDSKVVREIVERGKKVKDIKEKISQKLCLGKYDFILRINDVQLKDDDSFDNYEQDEKQTFIIHIQNPLYTFRLNIDSEKSSPKKFRMSPYTTIQEVKDDEENCFIDYKDEEMHITVDRIGEGATSITYKVFDIISEKTMCKKVLKYSDKITRKDLQNAVKEFGFLKTVHHPCICNAYNINISEPIKTDRGEEVTTVALFLEFLDYDLSKCLDKKILNNSMKARIVVEIAHGMFYIHKLGCIHRDLKIENIMLNSVFKAKIVDFGYSYINESLFTGESFSARSLSKGVGTYDYMSPEMINEEDYDSKTDVYSFGIVLYFMFISSKLEYKMKDKLNGKPIKLPKPSKSVSQFCLDLITNCTKCNPQDRPSFDVILADLRTNSFNLADGVDEKFVAKRDRELQNFK